MSSENRKCNKCLKVKPVSDFYKDRRNGSKRYECKVCHSNYYKDRWKSADKKYRMDRYKSHRKYLLKNYGICQSEYDNILKDQNNGCAICGVIPENESLSVDHCHETGKVRGLLCKPCNSAIGLLGDNPSGVFKALRYLEKFYGNSSSGL